MSKDPREETSYNFIPRMIKNVILKTLFKILYIKTVTHMYYVFDFILGLVRTWGDIRKVTLNLELMRNTFTTYNLSLVLGDIPFPEEIKY